MKSFSVPSLSCLALLALAACSRPEPSGEPGGPGARDLTPKPQEAPSPAESVLQEANVPVFSESTRAGAPGMTGQQRDSTGSR